MLSRNRIDGGLTQILGQRIFPVGGGDVGV